MYLAIIVLPLLGSIVSGFLGRKVGVSGSQFITCSSVILTTIFAIVAFFEVGLNNLPVSIHLFRWIDSESFNISWGFHFDSLNVSMLINKNKLVRFFSSDTKDNEAKNNEAKDNSFKFKQFFDKYSEYYPELPLPSKEFLNWFIGFSEGEGCFTVDKRGTFAFVIVQSSIDVQVLNYIKKNLGLGNIGLLSSKQKTHRYYISSFKNIHLICLLFNGNMVLPTRNARFLTFLSSFNEKLIKKNIIPINPITLTLLPSLTNGWLSGLVDGEGCFTVSFLANNKFRITFLITQKWEANKYVFDLILSLFKCNGFVIPRKDSDYWDLRINGLKNCSSIFFYFDKFDLKTKKKNSYLRWKDVHSRILKGEHLTDSRQELVNLGKQINKFN